MPATSETGDAYLKAGPPESNCVHGWTLTALVPASAAGRNRQLLDFKCSMAILAAVPITASAAASRPSYEWATVNTATA